MNRIYGVYDVHARYLRNLDIFPNDLVAFREYMLMIEKAIQGNPAIKLEDYKILCLGTIDNASDSPSVASLGYEVTVDSINEYLRTHPLGGN